MRGLLIVIVVAAVLAVAGWFGGEIWLSRQAAAQIEASPEISAEAAPLRQAGRFGLRLSDVEMGDAQSGLRAPFVDLFAPVWRPNAFSFDLPDALTLRAGGADLPVTLEGGTGFAAFAPTNRAALSEAGIDAQRVTLNGLPLLDLLEMRADLVHPGLNAPPGTGAAYDVTLDLAGLDAAAWTGIALPGALGAAGALRVWLTDAPGRGALSGDMSQPELIGAATDGLRLTLGGVEARLIGSVTADAAGLAEGEAAIYSTDTRALLEAAASLGIVPEAAVLPALAGLTTLSEVTTDAGSLPPAREGELRLPLSFANGESRIGPVVIGPAPPIRQ
ncbi:MAG: DUF2125 domain-containing protein [Paracoccus sp. (in: a-proteobacteria)]|nr:DUF2125 domain-containing protein [Paracoccus sp. (in: a-proteobacteria)]